MADRAEPPDEPKPADGAAPINPADAWTPLKDMLGSAAAAVSVISSVAFLLSVAYEQAYFSVIGNRFQNIASLTDYLTNALDWLPTLVALFGAYLIVTLVIAMMAAPASLRPEAAAAQAKLAVSAEQEAPSSPKQEEENKGTPWAILPGVMFGGLALAVYLTQDPASELWALILLSSTVWFFVVSFAASRSKDVPKLSGKPAVAAVLIPPIVGSAYGLGLQAAYRDLGPPRETYSLVRKDPSGQAQEALAKDSPAPAPEQVTVLRTFERGVLVRLPKEQVSQFLRWDEIRSIGLRRRDQPGKSLGCRQLGWFC